MAGGRDRYVPEPDDPGRPRLFFAVPVPDPARRLVGEVMDRVQASVGDGRAKIRWVRVEGLHLTLRFLGPTPRDRLAGLSRALDELAAATPRFPVVIARAGAFPNPGRPRTLWLGIETGADRLAALAAELEAAITEDGPPLGTKPFAPHLTIARTDGLRAAAAAAAALRDAAEALEARFTADRVVLYESHLGHGPARYEAVHEASLAG
ncbi:MAG TPA: RNA 2',3'-cyclic phosphodiesterase [Candidatus Limnocylindrales bacterium]|nr:RNA 2',3'-cyclic phosphodiesterase [Candidatus Limnocylindrales bacterium]